jgi:hypothetical protein
MIDGINKVIAARKKSNDYWDATHPALQPRQNRDRWDL